MDNPEISSQRLIHVLGEHGQKLSDALIKRKGPALTAEEAVLMFAAADPTHNKSMTRWLVTTYLKGGFRHEDINGGIESKAFDTLNAFMLHVRKLPEDRRDIFRYDTLADIYAEVEPFVKKENRGNEAEGREAKRRDRDKARAESRIIERPGLTVAIPGTEFASNWWGRGTRWCTTGKNSVFTHYDKQAPLFIIILHPDRKRNLPARKLQLHLVDNDVQFMDELDRDVKPRLINERWDVLRNIIIWGMGHSVHFFRLIPKSRLTLQICLKAIEKHLELVLWVPAYLMNREFIISALQLQVALDGDMRSRIGTGWIPKKLIDSEIAGLMLKCNTYLAFIPRRLHTPELCLLAVQTEPENLSAVSIKNNTTEICLTAVKSDASMYVYVPRNIKSTSIAEAVMEADAEYAFETVEPRYITQDLCNRYYKSLINYERIPEKYRSDEIMSWFLSGKEVIYDTERMDTINSLETAIDEDIAENFGLGM